MGDPVISSKALAGQMEQIYRDVAPEAIPWNSEDPPELLVQLVDSGRVRPCRAVDLGCGAGNYAVWLAGRGFQVTGVDLSPTALELGRRLAEAKGVSCEFIAADLVGGAEELDASFDFAYDWEVLHHVFPDERGRYVASVHRLLRPGGRYLSVCFSEDDPGFGGVGKLRRTPLGTTLYFSSEQELRELFEPLFAVDELATVRIAGKRGPHMVVRAFLTRRSMMVREVTLPPGVRGRLLLHSMPGLWEALESFLDDAEEERLTAVVRLTDLEEVRASSSDYAAALREGRLPFEVLSCDVPDHGVPDDRPAFWALARAVARRLRDGEAVLVHCYAGIGRTGTFAAAVLVALGLPVQPALDAVFDAGSGPESGEQEALVEWCASQASGDR